MNRLSAGVGNRSYHRSAGPNPKAEFYSLQRLRLVAVCSKKAHERKRSSLSRVGGFRRRGNNAEGHREFPSVHRSSTGVAELIEREEDSRLNPEESAELSHFLELEHILRMAKAKARLILANQS